MRPRSIACCLVLSAVLAGGAVAYGCDRAALHEQSYGHTRRAVPAAPGTLMSRLLDELTARAMRPRPVAPRPDPKRPDMVWVPDRWVPIPGEPSPARVPGHWERRLPGGEVFVPPLMIVHPDGRVSTVPAGPRRSPELRLGP